MSEWIEYTGSDDQISDIKTSEHGWMTEDFIVIDGSAPIHDLISVGDKYLICQPHPYADLIKIWADTGCPVWVRYEYRLSVGPGSETYVTDEPDFNIPGARYKLTPFED